MSLSLFISITRRWPYQRFSFRFSFNLFLYFLSGPYFLLTRFLMKNYKSFSCFVTGSMSSLLEKCVSHLANDVFQPVMSTYLFILEIFGENNLGKADEQTSQPFFC